MGKGKEKEEEGEERETLSTFRFFRFFEKMRHIFQRFYREARIQFVCLF